MKQARLLVFIFLGFCSCAYAHDCVLRLRGMSNVDLAEGVSVVIEAALNDNTLKLRRVIEFVNSPDWYNLFDKADASLTRDMYQSTFADISEGLDEGKQQAAKDLLRAKLSIKEAEAKIAQAAAEATAEVLNPEVVEKFEVPGMNIVDGAEVTAGLVEGRPVLVVNFAASKPGFVGVPFVFDPFKPASNHAGKFDTKEFQVSTRQIVDGVEYEVRLEKTLRKVRIQELASGRQFPDVDVSRFGFPYVDSVLLYKSKNGLRIAFTYQPLRDGPKTEVVDLSGNATGVRLKTGSRYLQLIETSEAPILCMSPVEAMTMEGLNPICINGNNGEQVNFPATSLMTNLTTTSAFGYPSLLWGGNDSITIFDVRKNEEIVVPGNFGNVRRILGAEFNGVSYAFVVAKERPPVLIRLMGRSRP